MLYRIYADSDDVDSVCECDNMQYRIIVWNGLSNINRNIDYVILPFNESKSESNFEDIVYPIKPIKLQYKMIFLRLQGV